jgi:hypothetical protein
VSATAPPSSAVDGTSRHHDRRRHQPGDIFEIGEAGQDAVGKLRRQNKLVAAIRERGERFTLQVIQPIDIAVMPEGLDRLPRNRGIPDLVGCRRKVDLGGVRLRVRDRVFQDAVINRILARVSVRARALSTGTIQLLVEFVD